jgi:hypothetical protein
MEGRAAVGLRAGQARAQLHLRKPQVYKK